MVYKKIILITIILTITVALSHYSFFLTFQWGILVSQIFSSKKINFYGKKLENFIRKLGGKG